MKTILITGGAGFIGSYLCDLFINKGFRVICIDNFITGHRGNLQHLQGNKNFLLIESDVSEYIRVEEAVDYILHFASPASPADYFKYPIQTLKVGALGTHNALGLAKAKKAVFLLASTSEVYGDPLVHPQSEDYWGNVNPIGQRGVYDEAKRFAEALTLAYYRTHGINTKIARIFNTYGPRMRRSDGRAIPSFITQALKNESVTVFGDGHQTRSFCYIDDMIDGIYRLLMSNVNEPVNLGNPYEMEILNLAKKIIDITGSKSKIVFCRLPSDDPKVRQPDITKAKTKLNWEPKFDLDRGLITTIEWFKNNRS